MYYCKPCALKAKWPHEDYFPKRPGQCQVCKQEAECVDVPSTALPKVDAAD